MKYDQKVQLLGKQKHFISFTFKSSQLPLQDMKLAQNTQSTQANSTSFYNDVCQFNSHLVISIQSQSGRTDWEPGNGNTVEKFQGMANTDSLRQTAFLCCTLSLSVAEVVSILFHTNTKQLSSKGESVIAFFFSLAFRDFDDFFVQ